MNRNGQTPSPSRATSTPECAFRGKENEDVFLGAVDLHLHTNRSDGTDAPARVVERAVEIGLAAIAITDHDTVAGVLEAESAARDYGLGFLRGVEISTQWRQGEIHILGLGVDVEHAPLLAALEQFRDARASRADRILEKLNAVGVSISREDIEMTGSEGSAIGRLHVARAVHRLGFASTVQDVFDKFIGANKPAYVERVRVASPKAIDLIRDAGGLAFLAHPGIGAARKGLKRLLELPFDGIEVYHSKHAPGQVERFAGIARERNLLISGGSDCHGSAKTEPEMGKVLVPYEYFERIQRALT